MMILYLAGLKAVDPSLREAAAMDGANERQTFFRVVFPVMRPINIVVLVITVIESLRAFDLAYIINKGINGLELLSTLITNNIIGETSRIGFGSAIAVVLLVIALGPIIFFLVRTLREEARVTDDRRPARRPRPCGARRQAAAARAGLHAFLTVMASIWLLPLVWAIYTAFRPYADTRHHGLRLHRRRLHSTTSSTPGTRANFRSTS